MQNFTNFFRGREIEYGQHFSITHPIFHNWPFLGDLRQFAFYWMSGTGSSEIIQIQPAYVIIQIVQKKKAPKGALTVLEW